MSEIITTTVLQNPKFIKILTETIIKENCPEFNIVQIDFLDNNSYFAVYKAESSVIVLEIQTNLTELSLTGYIRKCLDICDRFKVEPLLVILCVDKVDLSVTQHMTPALENPHWLMVTSNCWAEKCIVVPNNSIISTTTELDPLVVFAVCFSNDQVQKQR